MLEVEGQATVCQNCGTGVKATWMGVILAPIFAIGIIAYLVLADDPEIFFSLIGLLICIVVPFRGASRIPKKLVIQGKEMHCHNCNASLDEVDIFCSKCGNPVNYCYNCGAHFEEGSTFCPNCGNLVKTTVQAMQEYFQTNPPKPISNTQLWLGDNSYNNNFLCIF